jgi:hypothetical protein
MGVVPRKFQAMQIATIVQVARAKAATSVLAPSPALLAQAAEHAALAGPRLS